MKSASFYNPTEQSIERKRRMAQALIRDAVLGRFMRRDVAEEVRFERRS